MKKLNILMVNLAFLPDSKGGTEWYTYQLARALQPAHDVTVLTTIEDLSAERFSLSTDIYEHVPVIRIANSFRQQQSFLDSFIEPNIEQIFRRILSETSFDLIHFQHLAYLSGRLPEIAKQANIPSVFTLHDYWYFCFRSHLVRPGFGVCPGPSGGVHCASCTEGAEETPMEIPKYRRLLKLRSFPVIHQVIDKAKTIMPASMTNSIRSRFYKRNDAPKSTVQHNPHILTVLEHQFRFEFFKQQMSFAKVVMSPSHHLKNRYEAVGYPGIEVLPLGFERPPKIEELAFEGTLKLAFIGNILPNKNPILLLKECYPLRSDQSVELHFHGRIVDQQHFQDLQEIAKDYHPGTVHFHGEYDGEKDLEKILANVHAAVFPSLWEENSPLVLREALLRGVPVIASDLGGVSEVIQHGVNGLLFDPYKEGDLGNQINSLVTDPSLLDSITQGARNTKIESVADHVKKVTEVYARATAMAQSN